MPIRSYRSLLFKSTHDDHLRLVGKREGDFLLVLIKLFSLGRTAEALRMKIDRKLAKFQVEGHVSTNNFCMDS